MLQSLVTGMVAARAQQIEDSDLNDSGMLVALDELLSDGVLREGADYQWSPTRPIGFSHPVLFDYAAALVALGQLSTPDSLADALDEDPDLVMVLRPSLDYRLAIAWHNDPSRQRYWRLALRLAAERSGHMLAAAAAAAVAAHELRTASDLSELQSACVAPNATSAWTVFDARGLAFHLAACIGSTTVDPEVLDAFGELILALASQAATDDDVDLALVAAQLSVRAAGEHPPTAGTPAARCWVETAVLTVTVALADVNDPRRSRLAQMGGNTLAATAVLDPEATSDTIRAFVSEPTLRGWGTTPMRQLIDVVPEIAIQAPSLAVDVCLSVWLFNDDRSQPTNMLDSQILRLTSNRQQDLEGVRYVVGNKFAALAAADVLAAARLLVSIVQHQIHLHPNEPGEPSQRRPWIHHGETLRYIGTHDVIPKMVDDLAKRLEELAGSEDHAVEDAITLLTDGLTHAEVWARLLHRAATAESPALAQAFHAVLPGSMLLAHSGTWLAAGHVAARLSPTLTPAEHEALEQAILTATEPATDPHETRRTRLSQRRDTLLTALDRSKITSADALRHLEAIETAGRPVYPLAPALLDEDDMLLQSEPDEDDREPSPHDQLLQEVTQALAQTSRADERDQARQRLLTAWPALAEAHAEDPANETVLSLAMRAATHVAGLPGVLPDSAVGQQILTAVRAALPTASHGGQVSRRRGGRVASFTMTPQTEALTAVHVLISRPEWRTAHNDELGSVLLAHFDSPKWVYRHLSTRAIHFVYTDPDVLLAEAERRLAIESDQLVAGDLINAIGRHLRDRPADVDEIFRRLTALRGSPQLFTVDDGKSGLHDTAAGLVVHLLTILATEYGTAFADTTVRSWLAEPTAHPDVVSRIAGHLRRLLNPAAPSLRRAQDNAFELLTLTTEPLRSTWAEVTAGSTSSDDQTRAKNVVIVADHIAQQVYFASGAADTTNDSADQRGDPARFCDFALPLLERVASIHNPAVTHHIVETAAHLSDSQPKRALMLAQLAVIGDSSYANDPLGGDAVLDMITGYMANRRAIVLGDPDCTTAVRNLLERFVRVGWPRAIRVAEQMDEMYR